MKRSDSKAQKTNLIPDPETTIDSGLERFTVSENDMGVLILALVIALLTAAAIAILKMPEMTSVIG